MIAEQWEHIKELFETALNCSPEEKQSLLARLAEEDPGVADQVVRLLESYEKAGDFLVEPCCPTPEFLEDLSAEQQRFFPGDMVCSRFRIVSLLGRGGMGEVYKAWDEELEDHVALKTLRPEISTHELFTSRFRREIQLARKVTHSNVCRIFDSFKHAAGDGTYVSVLSMELLQGQNLADYLKAKGRLGAAEAMPLVEQIIAGLSAIHTAGILHRDLKPANLVLVAAGSAGTQADFQIKITDFGIAGRLPDGLSEAGQTEASKLLGTPDYMAPEQLEGSRATVQSDIYALGLVLYEMVTGVKPFAGASAWKRLGDDAPSPRRLVSGLPENWSKAIGCCLERNPVYRFQNTQAVLESLKDPVSATKIPAKPLMVRVRRAAKAKAGLVAGFLVLAVALSIGYFRYTRQRPEIPSGTTVLVTDIATSDPALSGITVALKSQLAQSAHFEVEEDNKIVEVLKQMNRKPGDPMDARTAREVALRSGAALVVSSSAARAIAGYVLSLKVERVKGNPLFAATTWAHDFSVKDKASLMDAVHEAAVWLRLLSGEPAADLAKQDRPVEDTTTSSWLALQLFTEAEQKYRQEDTEAAVLLLREAIHADADFAKAHMRLADILISRKEYVAGYAEWENALRSSTERQLTSRETLRLQGQYYEDTGDYLQAEKSFHEYVIHYPNDFLAWFYWGSALDAMDRREEAISAFQRAAILRPDSYLPLQHLAMLFLAARRFDEAQIQINKVRLLGSSEWSLWLEAHMDFLTEHYDSSLKQLQILGSSPAPYWKSQALWTEATFLAESGQANQAIDVLSKGRAFDHDHGLTAQEADKQLALGAIAYQWHRYEECKDSVLTAARLDPSPRRFIDAGTLLARSGYIRDAQVLETSLSRLPAIPRVRLAEYRLRGEIELARGHYLFAIQHFNSAARLARPREPLEFMAYAYLKANNAKRAQRYLVDLVGQRPRYLLYADSSWPGFLIPSLSLYLRTQDIDTPGACQLAQSYLHMTAGTQAQIFSDRQTISGRYEHHCNALLHN
jgi:serine/threonine protein kinase/tetratricopeptide (TPR) repeat protein